MVRNKNLGLLIVPILFLGLIPLAASISFNIQISDSTDYGSYGLNYTSEPLFAVDTTVENLGSIGCRYSLRAEFENEKRKSTVYSPNHALWPGESSKIWVFYQPDNYTGQVNSSVYIDYCGRSDWLKNVSYEVEEKKTVPDRSIESKELQPNSSGAKVEMETESGYMVPREKPGGWKVSTASIENGEAVLDYEAPIFQPQENITYAVVNESGRFLGTTKVRLKKDKPLLDRILEDKWKILFLFSIMVNLLMIYRSDVGLKQKLNL